MSEKISEKAKKKSANFSRYYNIDTLMGLERIDLS